MSIKNGISMKNGSVFSLPVNQSRKAVAVYSDQKMMLIYDCKSIDYGSLIQQGVNEMEPLFTCPVGFKQCSWEKVGEIHNFTTTKYKYYVGSAKEVVNNKKYINNEKLEVLARYKSNNRLITEIKTAEIQDCLGLETYAIYTEENILQRLDFYHMGQDRYGRGSEYYSTLGKLTKDAWFLREPPAA